MQLLHNIMVAIVFTISASSALAALVDYKFTGNITSVNSAAPDFPSSLIGTTVGNAFSGRLTYDAASPSATNPYGGSFASAAYYPLNSFSFHVTINTAAFSNWAGTPVAFVWNDADTIGSGCCNDGLLYTNITPSTSQFQFGNRVLPTSRFATDTLPGTSLSGTYGFSLGPANSSNYWVTGSFSDGLQVSAIPLPATVWFIGFGLPCLIGILRRNAALASAEG